MKRSIEQDFSDALSEEFGLNEAEILDRTLSFREFVDKAFPRYKWYRHCEVLADVLQRVADGELKRVMIYMAPRHGKSQLTTKLFSAYYLYRYPEKFVAATAYSAGLAYTFSRAARDAYRLNNGVIRSDAGSVKQWETPEGGGFWAAGVGGEATGKGYSLGIIDDPVKNHEEAFSEKIRERNKEWYGSTFYTRGESDAAIVVVQTRWHEDDLSGYLINQETADDEPESWHIVNFAAIKEEADPVFPPTCTVEPDWREPGEPLCPERFPLARLRRIAKRIGTYFWNSLFQQRPAPLDGDFFKRKWWKFYKILPELSQFEQVIQSWDCTFKDSEGSDFVVGQVWGKRSGEFYLIDQVRDRMDINSTIQAVRAMSAKFPMTSAILVEDKANGPAVISMLQREIPGIIAINPEGGKKVRAIAIAPYVESGNVFLPEATEWIGDYIDEFSRFPNGRQDDQVDSTSQALNWLQSHQPGVWGESDVSWGY